MGRVQERDGVGAGVGPDDWSGRWKCSRCGERTADLEVSGESRWDVALLEEDEEQRREEDEDRDESVWANNRVWKIRQNPEINR